MITGDRTVEIEASAEHVYGIVVDADAFPAWNPSVNEVDVRETGEHGLPEASRVVLDAKVRAVKLNIRYVYSRDDPRMMRFVSEKGSEVKSVVCEFVVHETGTSTCAVRMAVEVDPGRTLGLLLRGPVVDKVRDHLIDGTLTSLKARAEG